MINGKNDTVNELITKHLAGETSPEEEKELFSWINHNEENKRHYAALKKAFQLTAQHFSVPAVEPLNIDVEREWDLFKEHIGETGKIRPLTAGSFWLRIAATVLLLMATGGVLYYFTAPGTTVYQTASNKETITLPDGSKITLNRFSRLSFEPDFDEENRTINFQGEAFFDVEPNKNKPFIILTDKAKVEVVGTSFNVNAYDSLQEIEVVVKTGIVSLQSKGGDRKVRLAAGQKGVYSKAKEQLVSSVNEDVNFLSWNTGHIVFVETDLRSVIETLERTYHADITVATDIPPSCMVTVTFDHQSLASVLKVLESTLNLKYTLKGNKVEITEAGC